MSKRVEILRKWVLGLLLMIVTTVQAQTKAEARTEGDYQMAGPYEVIARDGQYRHTKAGSERDMHAALDLAKAGKHDEARRIFTAYANTLQRIEGHDAPLCLIQGYWLLRSLTLNEESRTKNGEFDSFIKKVILPVIDQFEANSPYANGNWGAIVNRCRMACAICLQDSTLYQASIDYFLHGYDNGSLPRYVSETGQCQETGRDQQHVQLGLQALADICEMAWEQHGKPWVGKQAADVDLYAALDNRLLKGLEYTAKYNLGYDDVPFQTWQDCTGLYCEWAEPGSMGRGRIRDIYREPYHHYVERCGLQMPYTKKLLALQERAEKKGGVKRNMEADEFMVKGVKEVQKLHQLFAYPAPAGAPLKHDYEVYARPRGSEEWTKIDTYMAKVNAPASNPSQGGMMKHKVTEISYALFDFTGDVFVRVVKKNPKTRQPLPAGREADSSFGEKVCIRPAYRGVIPNVKNDSTVEFLLFQPENLSIELDGDITSNLLLFTSKPPITMEQAMIEAKKQGRRFIYFPPGLYDQAAIDSVTNHSPLSRKGGGGESFIYLAGGSYFTGTFAIEDAENVSILGRGIARPKDGYEGCHVHRSKNVLIDGLIVNTCPIGESDGVTLHDVRSISHPAWGDGLNVFASSNVLYDRVFCRNSDDCTTAYATRKGFNGNARNIRMKNSTLWADVAHPIFIGIHGNAERGDTIENIVYENIDILGQWEPQIDYQGCLAINCGDNNLVRNVLFDNIRIEQMGQGCLFQVKVGYNQKYCAAPGRGVENVTFRNIRSLTPNPSPRGEGSSQTLSIINGYDEERKVKNITFEGLKINGRTIHDKMPGKPGWYATSDYVPAFVGNHVEGVVFKPLR